MNKRVSEFFAKLLPNRDLKTCATVLMSIFVISGVFGFLYETVFYFFNDGEILRRGTTFGPYIQLYSWGGLLLFLALYTRRKNPLLVLLASGLLAGGLEFIVGYLLYHLGNGYRGWDYNTEIWNWGNIGGYVCFRSVAFFALSGMLLIYVIVPLLLKLTDRFGTGVLLIVAAVLTGIYLLDIVYNDILADRLGWMNAREWYRSIGWKVKEELVPKAR